MRRLRDIFKELLGRLSPVPAPAPEHSDGADLALSDETPSAIKLLFEESAYHEAVHTGYIHHFNIVILPNPYWRKGFMEHEDKAIRFLTALSNTSPSIFAHAMIYPDISNMFIRASVYSSWKDEQETKDNYERILRLPNSELAQALGQPGILYSMMANRQSAPYANHVNTLIINRLLNLEPAQLTHVLKADDALFAMSFYGYKDDIKLLMGRLSNRQKAFVLTGDRAISGMIYYSAEKVFFEIFNNLPAFNKAQIIESNPYKGRLTEGYYAFFEDTASTLKQRGWLSESGKANETPFADDPLAQSIKASLMPEMRTAPPPFPNGSR